MKIIGLLGKKRAGKDTVAGRLVEAHGFVRAAFGDELKKEVAAIHGVSVDLLNDDELKETPLAALGGVSPRKAMQDHGTLRRSQDPDYWIAKVDALIRTLPGNYVISDVRLPNEYEFVRSLGGVLVRVLRPGMGATDAHESEVALDAYPADETLTNVEGRMQELLEAVDALHALRASAA